MISEDELREAVVQAVRNYDVGSSSAWSDLDELSTHTFLEQVEVDPSGIVLNENGFSGVANLYLTLQFGHDEEEGFRESESFLAKFSGTFDADGEATLDDFTVDTSSRFGPPDEALRA